MSLARKSYSTNKSFAMSGTTRWCRGRFAKEQRDLKIRSEMGSEDYIRDGKWKCWWDWRWKVKVMMRSEMESESEGEIRDGKWKRGGDQRGKVRSGSAKKKIGFFTVRKKDAQHKQIQIGHLTDVQLLSNWLEVVAKLFPSGHKKGAKMSSSCQQTVVELLNTLTLKISYNFINTPLGWQVLPVESYQ